MEQVFVYILLCKCKCWCWGKWDDRYRFMLMETCLFHSCGQRGRADRDRDFASLFTTASAPSGTSAAPNPLFRLPSLIDEPDD